MILEKQWKNNMKQFSLEEYLKNPNRKIVTRNGSPIRIICTDRLDCDFPIVTLMNNGGCETIISCRKNGKLSTCKESKFDLFFAPEKKIKWLNIYKDDNGDPFSGGFYKTKEEAIEHKLSIDTYIDTIKIEDEE